MYHQFIHKGLIYSFAMLAALAALLVLPACHGDTGPAGTSCTVTTVDSVKTIHCEDGTTVTISDGKNAADTGTITGTIAGDIGGAAEGVTVKTTPDVGQTATTDAQGAFTLTLPIGTYVLNFSSSNYQSKDLPAFSVTGGSAITVAVTLTAINPITLRPKVATAPAGFGAQAQLDVTVTGGTEPYTFSWVAKATNPTAVTLSDSSIKNPTFTTGSLAAVLAALVAQGDVVGISGLTRKGFVPISAQQLVQMSYSFDVTVTDAEGFSKTATATVPPATLAQGSKIVPRNQIVILNLPNNTDILTLTKPEGSAATLHEILTQNPWFIPDVIGRYTVADLTVNVSDFVSAQQDCGQCHNANEVLKADVDAKFKTWANSAHANHYFKFMEYDTNGQLVWKTDSSSNPIPAPTGDPNIFWTSPGAMSIFEFGMTGGEGSHYSSSCIACHTTGYNALAANGGFDDVAAADGWVFPNLKTALGGDAITTAPVFSAWNAIPADLKKYQGIQCESCHGPLGNHAGAADGTLFEKPVAEYDVGTCAVCHDKPANHDRVALWRKSGHANLDLALEEAIVESRGTSTSCYRCHAAQGFVQYLQNKATNPDGIDRPSSLSQSGFSTCTPGVGYRDYNQPLDPACACKLTSATNASSPTSCADDSGCSGANAGYCVTTGLNTAGTGFNQICVKKTCKPSAITCTPSVGHRLSSDDLDPACPCKPSIAVSIPFTPCTTDTECSSANVGSICIGGQCVWPDCAADPAFYAYLDDLGLNHASAQPQTCAACHEAHSTEIRVDGDTGPLGNGAQAQAAGAGALCMVCHNTRNGARGDFVTTSSIGGPHSPVQTDLFLGVNAYFMGAGGTVSRHAAVEDTCVGCHLKMAPADLKVANTNHTFVVDGSICQKCHSDSVSIEGLEGQFMVARGNLEKAFATAVSAALNTGTSSAPVYDYYIMAINPAANGTTCSTACAFDELCDDAEAIPTCEKKVVLTNLTVAPVSIVPSGRTANLAMSFASVVQNPFGTPTTVTTLSTNYLNVSQSNVLKLDNVNLSVPKFGRTGIIAKANWNYWLVSSVSENPAANMIHNPSFVFDVLSATTTNLLASKGVGL
jgi:hypothetical protein